MLSNLQWIIILMILIILCISSLYKDEGLKDYDCYKKSLYKCSNCRKRCKWRYIANKFKEME